MLGRKKADVNYFWLGVVAAVILIVVLLIWGVGPISVKMANIGKALGAFT